MRDSRVSRILRRTPGEMAFDRCFFPLAALFFASAVFVALTLGLSSPAKPRGEADLASELPIAPGWPSWLLFGLGLVIAFLWSRALVSVVRAWRDPSARVLRFASLGLLIPLAYATVCLLRLPFS